MTAQAAPPMPLAAKLAMCAVGAGCLAAAYWAVSGHDFKPRTPPPIYTYYEEPAEPSNDATSKALAMMRADPLTGTTQRACLDAIDKANYASHHLSSEEAIQASTDMLRVCEAK